MAFTEFCSNSFLLFSSTMLTICNYIFLNFPGTKLSTVSVSWDWIKVWSMLYKARGTCSNILWFKRIARASILLKISYIFWPKNAILTSSPLHESLTTTELSSTGGLWTFIQAELTKSTYTQLIYYPLCVLIPATEASPNTTLLNSILSLSQLLCRLITYNVTIGLS
jgi:hypothetical protein